MKCMHIWKLYTLHNYTHAKNIDLVYVVEYVVYNIIIIMV